jgi:hypothetical protein
MKEWSDSLVKITKDSLEGLTFGVDPITKNVRVKRNDGSLGYIKLDDALNNVYTVVVEHSDPIHFGTVQELIQAGWVLD